MRISSVLLLALLLPATASLASPAADAPAPAEQAHGAVGAALKPGANSFTAAQVQARFAELGFSQITDLRLDDQGIWRGRASHAGRSLTVGMDYRGEVAAE